MILNLQAFDTNTPKILQILDHMKPKKPANKNRQRELFRVELVQIIDTAHGLVKLADVVDWDQLEKVFGATFCPDNGRPAISTRLMVALHLKRVNVDTTVQEKEIRFPTDARLYDRARQRLVAEAKRRDIDLRQNYNRLSKQLLAQQSRYAHAKQIKRAKRCTRRLKTYLGRVIRDIERNCRKSDEALDRLLDIGTRIYRQKRKDKNKIYSVHEPEVNCISKGKAHKRYEFGCKVSVAATSKGGWFAGAMAVEGNPYDGHTLCDTLEQVERIARKPLHAFVDMGYRGHGYEGDVDVHVDKRRRGRIAKSLWHWMKRRAAIEPGIGHLKREHRMDRNRLKGTVGDRINAILSAAGMNFAKLLKWAAALLRLIFYWLFGCQRTPLLMPTD